MREYLYKPYPPEKAKELLDPEYHELLDLALELARKHIEDIFIPTQEFLEYVDEKLQEALNAEEELGGFIEYIVVDATPPRGFTREVFIPVRFIDSPNIVPTPESMYAPHPYDVLFACEDILYGSPNGWSLWYTHPDDHPPSCLDLRIKYDGILPFGRTIEKWFPEDYHDIWVACRRVPHLLLTGGTTNYAMLYAPDDFYMLPPLVRTPNVASMLVYDWAKEYAGREVFEYYDKKCDSLARSIRCYAFWAVEVEEPVTHERRFEVVPFGGKTL